jgi:hypothetical protein
MALALHRLTGLPLMKIVGQRKSRSARGPKWCDEPAHVGVKSGPGRWIDADGEHRGIPRERLMFLRAPKQVVMKPSTIEEVKYLYALDGVPERQITSAVRDALDDPLLGSIVDRYR